VALPRSWWVPAVIVTVVAVAVVVVTAAVAVLSPGSWPGVGRDADAGGAGAGLRAVPTDPVPQPPGERRFPDAGSTGVPDGVDLTRTGSVTVHDDGAVIENLLVVDGPIEVFANDVTIRNVRVTNDRRELHWGISQGEGYRGLVVEDSEVYGNRASDQRLGAGIVNHGGMITVRRVDIHTVTDGVMTSHGLIEDSFIHSPRLFEGDHTDMVQMVGGSPDGLPLVIRNNTIVNTEDQTAAVFLSDATGTGQVPVHDVLVEGNLLAGGGFTVYGGGMVADGRDPRDIVIRDNVFSRHVWPDGGFWGPITYFDPDGPGNVWSGNVWDDGSPVDLGY
jgi:hypothetical protein